MKKPLTYRIAAAVAALAGERLERERPAMLRRLDELAPVQSSVNLREARAAQRSVDRANARREAFAGARMSRLEMDWTPSSLPPDEEIRYDLRRLRARSRDLSRNTPQGKHYRNLLTVNVLGHQGIRLQCQRKLGDDPEAMLDDAANRIVEKGWRGWSRGKVTVDKKQNLRAFASLALKTIATDGEVFIRRWFNFANPYGYALQMIDADLVDEHYSRQAGDGRNEIRMGVEIDSLGAPVAYHVHRFNPYYVHANSSFTALRDRIPAEEMLHLYVQERPNQTRGIPWFAPVMMRLNMLDGYIESELVGARVSSSKMGFIEAKDDTAASVTGPDGESIAAKPMMFNAAPGTIEQLNPGWTFNAWDPTHPNTAFADFIKAISRDFWSGLGVSYNSGANDLEGVNYSSMRSGLLIERDIWRQLQVWMSEELYEPVYEDFLRMGILTGALPLRNADHREYMDVEWIPRGWAWVDPLKEAQAAEIQLGLGLTSRSRLLAEQGFDVEDTFAQLGREEKLRAKHGLKLAQPGEKSGPPPPKPGDDEEEDDDAPPSKNGVARRTRREALRN